MRSDEEGLPAHALRALIDKLPDRARAQEWELSFNLGDEYVVVQKKSDGPASAALDRAVLGPTVATRAGAPADDDLLVGRADPGVSGGRDPLEDVTAAVDRMRKLPF